MCANSGPPSQFKDVEFLAVVHRQGRIIVPKNIRQILEIETGDVMKLTIKDIIRKEYPLRR